MTVVGPPGPPGKNGLNGTDGTNGRDGKDGRDGRDGVKVRQNIGLCAWGDSAALVSLYWNWLRAKQSKRQFL